MIEGGERRPAAYPRDGAGEGAGLGCGVAMIDGGARKLAA
jgi:hypothetical protein